MHFVFPKILNVKVILETSILKTMRNFDACPILHVCVAKSGGQLTNIWSLVHSMEFLSPEVALYLYESTIRLYMEYCCHI